MSVYYSASTNGFYPDFMIDSYDEKGSLPGDLVKITDKQHENLIASQNKGMSIISDSKGKPILQPVQVDNENEQVDKMTK